LSILDKKKSAKIYPIKMYIFAEKRLFLCNPREKNRGDYYLFCAEQVSKRPEKT